MALPAREHDTTACWGGFGGRLEPKAGMHLLLILFILSRIHLKTPAPQPGSIRLLDLCSTGLWRALGLSPGVSRAPLGSQPAEVPSLSRILAAAA